jgi:hypothetical protein
VEIAELVGVGCIVVVALCVGFGVTPGSVLTFPNGAQAESSSNVAKSANMRRGICIGVSYLSCIAIIIETRDSDRT